MATKKKSTKKTTEKAPKKSTTRKPETAIDPVEVAAATPDTQTSETPTSTSSRKKTARAKDPKPRDFRLPAPGTIIRKVDRHGATRCEVKVLEDGFDYKGQTFRTISGAARAAAGDLGLKNRAVNGLVFFGITRPASRGSDPVESLKKAGERYASRAGVLTSTDITAEQRLRAVEAIEWHAEVIAELRGKLQTVGA